MRWLRLILTPAAVAADLLLVGPVLGAPDCPCADRIGMTTMPHEPAEPIDIGAMAGGLEPARPAAER